MKEYFKVQTVLDDNAVKEYVEFMMNGSQPSLFRNLSCYVRISVWTLLGIIFFSTLAAQITEGFTEFFFYMSILLLIVFFVLPWYVKQKIREGLLLRQRETISTFYEMHVLVQRGQFSERVQYEEFACCYETNRFFYLYTKSKKSYILSKTHFLVGNIEQFYRFFSNQTGLSIQTKQESMMVTPSSILTKENSIWIYKVIHSDFVQNTLGVRIRPFGGQLWYNGETMSSVSRYLNDNALHSRLVNLERKWFILAPLFLRIDKEVVQITRQPNVAERITYSFAVFFLCFCLLAICFCLVISESFIQQAALITGAATLFMMGILYFWIMRNWLFMRYAPFWKYCVAICGYVVVLLSAIVASAEVQVLIEAYYTAGWQWV